MEEVKINNRNMILGLLVMVACAYIGAISTVPHQTDILTTAINIPAQITNLIEPQQPSEKFSEEEVSVALNSNEGIINVMNLMMIAKIIVIVAVAGIVFMLLATTGLIPRLGGMS